MLAIVHHRLSEQGKSILKSKGCVILEAKPANSGYSDVFSHPDIQIHRLHETLAITSPELYSYYRNRLPQSITLLKGDCTLGGTYPKDCAYNVATAGNTVLYNPKTAAPEILKYYQDLGYTFCPVNQGYTNCNVLSMGKDTLFTEDVGIYQSAQKAGLTPILLPVGEIRLLGFPYGFIGGTCGLHQETLFFYGSLSSLSYGERIRQEAKNQGISITELTDEPMEDSGGIIFFSS